MQLVSPNGLDIVGALNVDGSLRGVSYPNKPSDTTLILVLETAESPTVDPLVLVDSAGTRWDRDEVEWHTILHGS